MIAPFVALLASEDFKETGSIYEVGGGCIKKLRWQRTEGLTFSPEENTPENILKNWKEICDWSKVSYPTCPVEDSLKVMFKKKETDKVKV